MVTAGLLAAVGALVGTGSVSAAPGAWTTYSAAPAPGPATGLGPAGTSLMHGDLWSTDSTQNPGPGAGAHVAASSVPGGACAATFLGSDGMPVALCTQFVSTAPPAVVIPTVTLFDPRTAAPLARLALTKGRGLLGGVYGYLDDRDRVVVGDASGTVLRVAHRRTAAGWRLFVSQRIDVSRWVPAGDAITALAPAWPSHGGTGRNQVWFATTHGVVGIVDGAGRARTIRLPRGEDLGNGLSVRAGGVSVITTHALYEVRTGGDGAPQIVWRRAYDRGPARRPGQLTWGSGTTPTYFGPGGDGWVAIVDNAEPPNLIVYRSADGSQVCRMRAFGTSGPGTENSPMAWGDSLVIPSTYGYEYPPQAVDGPSVPARAAFSGGATRIDVSAHGCRRIWESSDRLASLPKLSRDDGLIHALGYGPYVPGAIAHTGPVFYVAIDFATGRRVVNRQVGVAPADEPLQLTGTIGPDGSLWQATIGRMLKVAR